MELTTRQFILLTVAINNFYDEVARTSTLEMKREVMELSKIIQRSSVNAKSFSKAL